MSGNRNNKMMKEMEDIFELLNRGKCIDMLLNMGLGVKPSNGDNKSPSDCHFWLEKTYKTKRKGKTKQRTKIIDPTPPAYEGKRYYKPFKQENQDRILKYYNDKIKNLTKEEKENIIKTLYKNPIKRMCGWNTYAYWSYHKNKNLKIVIGSLGFQLPNGKVF